MIDTYLADSILRDDPLLDAAGIEPAVARPALGLPPPLPSRSEPGWWQRVLTGTFTGSERLERFENLLVHAARCAAMAPSLKDPAAWARAAAKRYNPDSVLSRFSPTDVDLDLLRDDLAVSRSFDLGHPRTVALLGEARARVGERLERRSWPFEPDPSEYEPATQTFPEIQEHDDRTSFDGQAADMAAGWARSEYLAAPTHEAGIRRLCGQFAGVIFNGTLHQRS